MAAEGSGRTPVQMVLAQLYPVSQNLTNFLFRQFAQDLSYFYMYTKKLGKQTSQSVSLNCTFTGSLYSLFAEYSGISTMANSQREQQPTEESKKRK